MRHAKESKSSIAEKVDLFRKKYDEVEPAFEAAKESIEKIKKQIHGADKKLREISSSAESNNLRLFGEKRPAMASKVGLSACDMLLNVFESWVFILIFILN